MAAFVRKRVVLNDKGVAVWLVLLIIAFVFLPFMVLTIDMAYVYYTRGQLHNAADAAALAGVSGIDNMNDLVQAEARTRAIFFASKNGAAGGHVLLNSDNSNTLSDTNDITVGNWNGTTSTYAPGVIPINAVQAVARRTENRPNGEFGLMFGFAIGRSFMNIGAAAIASLPARAEAPVMLCLETCDVDLTGPGGDLLYWDPKTPKDWPEKQIIAWTIFSEDSAIPDKDIKDLICEKKSVAACNKTVHTKMGVDTTPTLRRAFKSPTYDTVNKTYDSNGRVYSWTVIVPIVDTCPPSKQPGPYEIVQYAEVTIIEVYPVPEGNPPKKCPDCPEADYDHYNFPSDEIKGAIKISYINCVGCPEADMTLLGRTPVLVR